MKTEWIAPYLAHELKCEIVNDGETVVGTLMAVYNDGTCAFNDIVESEHDFESVKPLLKPLENYKEIVSSQMSDLGGDLDDEYEISCLASEAISLATMTYSSYELAIRNHVDVFRLIDKGLAKPKQ